MAVNGIEIVEGSKWITKGGEIGVIEASDRVERDTWPWVLSMEDGSFYTYTSEGVWFEGECNAEDLSHPLVLTLNTETMYSITEITDAFKSIGWGGINVLFDKLQELKDPEYAEYLRLKNKFQK